MSWQDMLFGVGGFFFAASLIPTIRSKTAEVPLKTSVPTAALLAAYVPAEWTVHLHLGAIAGCASATAWALIALLRRPKHRLARLYYLDEVTTVSPELFDELLKDDE